MERRCSHQSHAMVVYRCLKDGTKYRSHHCVREILRLGTGHKPIIISNQAVICDYACALNALG